MAVSYLKSKKAVERRTFAAASSGNGMRCASMTAVATVLITTAPEPWAFTATFASLPPCTAEQRALEDKP